jgi:hypothetical protein
MARATANGGVDLHPAPNLLCFYYFVYDFFPLLVPGRFLLFFVMFWFYREAGLESGWR